MARRHLGEEKTNCHCCVPRSALGAEARALRQALQDCCCQSLCPRQKLQSWNEATCAGGMEVAHKRRRQCPLIVHLLVKVKDDGEHVAWRAGMEMLQSRLTDLGEKK